MNTPKMKLHQLSGVKFKLFESHDSSTMESLLKFLQYCTIFILDDQSVAAEALGIQLRG